ncbi:MAG: hypothetical protein J6A59_09310 [Lachnospiraceae bacterium]|nr:hypothetical protein [Lachnospiraceae bacterium]
MFIKVNLNPNKRKAGDCAIRAVSAATGLTWDEAYIELAQAGFILKVAMNDIEAINFVLKKKGFSVGKIRIQKGDRRPTVEQFSAEHPNWYCVLRVANHLVASGKGNYVDSWDSGECAVYKYWYKEIN